MSTNVSESEKRTDSEQSTNSNSPESSVSWYDLTGFKRDILRVVATMESERARMAGVEIKSRLEDRYDESINHGLLYPNLDDLAGAGLIEKGEIDKRTNSYELSEPGREMLREQREAWVDLDLSRVVIPDGGEVDR
ncbi:PadR family transcriptional regulator [Halolamina salifodinae]|uniref:DNA-binding PadR family transcriptional regulator n=1 Tax=Halolamina salifodinae TaxID=1202767 RepID=A0A8T4GWD0_9EURY|nr:PadR family transcriptional regulator [Halolamina salifodinae]MBP1987216.1 DNA-binding PadR family transcriptional regulator [Halolamina salifodinae]